MEILSAKLDIVFKTLFINNPDILHGFISDILDIPYDSIKNIIIDNPEIPPYDIDGKFSRLDLKLQIDNKLVNVEMQIKRYNDFFDRSLFYWAKMYSSGLKSGEEYSKLRQTIAINIVDFNMFDWEDYHSEFAVMEKNKKVVLSDKLCMHFFELRKLNRIPDPNDKKALWMQVISAENEEELNMITKTNVPTVQKAVVELKKMSEDDKMRERARIREKAMHDEASALSQAKSEGRAEGRNELLKELIDAGFSKDALNRFFR